MIQKIILVSFTLSLPLLFFYVFEPHIIQEELRSTDQIITIKARYAYANKDTNCIQLYRLDNDKPDRLKKDHILPAFPPKLALPEDHKFARDGNILLLSGYAYQHISTNLLSNQSKKLPSPRFDVISWKLETAIPTHDKPHSNELYQYDSNNHDPNMFSKILTQCDPK